MNNNQSLIIVESPGKIKKIKSFLDNNYIVLASAGHIMDLPSNSLGIDLQTFEPLYTINKDKINIVKDIKKVLKNVSTIYIASDQDREGEFIGFSLVTQLKLKNNYHRIVFNEITKSAIIKAINNPIKLNYNLIKAQQCRRIIDRLIGYLISPILSNNVNGAKGAGRVQSIILKIILDSIIERNIYWNNISNNSTYYSIDAIFKLDEHVLTTKMYFTIPIQKIDTFLLQTNKNIILKIFLLIKDLDIKPNKWVITNIKIKNTKIYPDPPYITSSLQQDAYIKLKFNPEKTMKIAQLLYEKGYITYIRTDSYFISNEASTNIKNYIYNNYGFKYYKFKQYKTKSINTQEAHECIRPSYIDKLYDNINDIDIDSKKLYKLIWERTIACQMAECIMENTEIMIKLKIKKNKLLQKSINYCNNLLYIGEFKGSCSKIIELGFKIIFSQKTNKINFDLTKINNITLLKMESSESIKQPPSLYNQASIIKILEKNGIGRPSTYVNLIKKNIDYKYIKIDNISGIEMNLTKIYYDNKNIKIISNKITMGCEKQKLIVTDLGNQVIDFLSKYFNKLLDYKFTSYIENKLDLITTNQIIYKDIISEYYNLLITAKINCCKLLNNNKYILDINKYYY
jgi:DNA topoisomerase-1